MNTPFFSIGIPIFNTEKYLRGCIDSVLNQSFTDFELILVDDGSTDSCFEICKEYAGKDSRVKVYHKENSGISHTRNCLLDYSCGKYIFQLDSDDRMCEDLLEKVYNELIKNDYPDVLLGRFLKVFLDGKIEQMFFPAAKPEWKESTNDYLVACMIANDVIPSHMCRKFIKLSVIRDNNIRFDSKYVVGEDRDFTAKLSRSTESFYYTDINTIYWNRRREGSITTVAHISAALSDLYCFNDYMIESETWNIPEDKREEVRLYFVKAIRDMTIGAVWRKREDTKIFADEVNKIIDKRFKQDLKKIKTDDKTYGIIFKLYNVFGVKNTMMLYNFYLNMRGAIK